MTANDNSKTIIDNNGMPHSVSASMYELLKNVDTEDIYSDEDAPGKLFYYGDWHECNKACFNCYAVLDPSVPVQYFAQLPDVRAGKGIKVHHLCSEECYEEFEEEKAALIPALEAEHALHVAIARSGIVPSDLLAAEYRKLEPPQPIRVSANHNVGDGVKLGKRIYTRDYRKENPVDAPSNAGNDGDN
jgi:hypothetical protein